MLGIIPGTNETFEVYGTLNEKNPIEGKLYYDEKDMRVYYYSREELRSSPKTGYFPVWNGNSLYTSKFSKQKYFDKDVIVMDVSKISNQIDEKKAEDILYYQRRSDNNEILNPPIQEGDNMFTQCIKGVIRAKQFTMVDLVDMAAPKLNQEVVESYYQALMKITFMRISKWDIWIHVILHLGYELIVYKENKQIISYKHPQEIYTFEQKENYQSILNSKEDAFKKVIKILIQMFHLTKNDLKSDDLNDYTINNMITTIHGPKPLSSQLFSRFLRMANFTYTMDMYEKDQIIFHYQE